MAKTYSIKNISTKPPRPIGLMAGRSSAADGSAFVMIGTDVPVNLTAGQYQVCKDALARLEAADMVAIKVMGSDDPVAGDDVEDIDELREQAKELGVKSWHVMGAEKLREAIDEKLGA